MTKNQPGTADVREPVVVATAPNVIEADMRRAFLEGYGIPVMYRSDAIVSWRSIVTVGPLATVRLLVPASRAEEAAALLRDAEGPTVDRHARASWKVIAVILLIAALVAVLSLTHSIQTVPHG